MRKYILNINEKYNEWTIINDVPKTLTKSRQLHYECECSCKLTIRYVNASDLVNSRSKCCNRCTSYKGTHDLSGTFLTVIKRGAKKRNLEFDVTIEYLYDLYILQNKKCALSGVDISLHRNYSQGFRSAQNASLDRIDNTKGYIVENLQWVHKDINMIKNVYSQEYFIEMCKQVANYAAR